MATTELMGVDDARRALGVSRWMVHALVRRGGLSPLGRIGIRGQYVFDAADVQALAKERADDKAL